MSKKVPSVWLLTSLLLCSRALPGTNWTEKYLSGTVENSLDSIYASSSREVISLNGDWQARRTDEETWHRVQVPGAYDFEGVVEFRRTFIIDSTFTDHSFQLVAYGISNRCKLFLNDQFIGSHDWGLTIELDIRKLNIGAENVLRIVTDNTLRPRSGLPLQHSPGLNRNYGGIFQDIFLLAKPLVFIDSPVVQKKFSENFQQCDLSVASTIYFPEYLIGAGEFNFFIEIWDPDRNSLLVRSERRPVQFQKGKTQGMSDITLRDFVLWTPDHPTLYELRLYLAHGRDIVDEMRLDIGFNQVSVHTGTLQLNGKPVELKGVDWYNNFPESGPVADWSALERDMQSVKNLGANAVHVIGGVPHPQLVRICDRLGLLAFTELPLSFVPPQRFTDPVFVRQIASYFEAMMQRHQFHPSAAAIGVGRDIKLGQQDFPVALKKVFSKVEAPLYLSFRFLQPERVPEDVDFIWIDWYEYSENAGRRRLQNLRQQTRPVFMSCGSRLEAQDASHGNAGNGASLRPQEWQAAKLHRVMQQLSEYDPAGLFIHTFADWRGVHPQLGFAATNHPLLNQTGLVSFDRQRRIAYELVEGIFKNREPLRVSVQSDTAQTPNTYPVVGLGLILFFLFIFKRSRRFRGNLQRIYKFPHGFYTELRENRRVPVLHTLILGFLASAILGTIFSSLAFDLRDRALFDEILNHFIVTDSLKLKIGHLIWQPALSIAVISISLFLIGVVLSVVLRAVSFVLGVRLPSVQFVTLVFWASAHFIFLLPIIPIYHRIISQTGLFVPAVFVVLLFGLWFIARLVRGVKITFLLSVPQMLVLVIVLIVIIGGGLGWYLDRELALFDYMPLYWAAVRL